MQTEASGDCFYHELYLDMRQTGSTCQSTAAMEKVRLTFWHERGSTWLPMTNVPQRSILVRRLREETPTILRG